MKKILLIGPISESGGREVMTKFLYNAFKQFYDVSIFSTIMVSRESIAFKNVPSSSFKSIWEQIAAHHKILSVIGHFVKLFFSRKEPHYFFLNNKLTKPYFNFERILKKTLVRSIQDVDHLLYSGELNDKWLGLIIDYCSNHKKQLTIRVTGKIEMPLKENLFKEVSLIVHSKENYQILQDLNLKNIIYINQSTNLESELLKIPLTVNDDFKYGYVGRLSSEKGILELLNASKELGLSLQIAGDGPLKNDVFKLVSENSCHLFLGNLETKELLQFYKDVDVIIISSFNEGGPIVGIEAMAAGKLIISTKVGAMPERLKNTQNEFFIEQNSLISSLKQSINDLNALSFEEKLKIKSQTREKYIQSSSLEKVKQSFLKAIS